MKENASARLMLVSSMFIFGTIGIFRRFIPLPSSLLAMARGLIGMLFLLVVLAIRRQTISRESIQRNLLPLCLSGGVLGFNWILLFEAYRYTTVATATLCYYMAPIFVILVSPLFFGERLTGKKACCVAVALVGMILVSGVLDAGFSGGAELTGILLGLGAALLYAGVMILNKTIKGVAAFDKTIMQLGTSTIILLPYTLLTENVSALSFDFFAVCMLLVVGVVHTGVAYALYFGSMGSLKAQTIALFSYIDPVIAILLSAFVLKENIGVSGLVGAVLVLGSTLVSEFLEG